MSLKKKEFLTSNTDDESTSSGSRITCTLRLMVSRCTCSILCTCILFTNRYTSLTEELTSLIISTILIYLTFYTDTGNLRVPLQSYRTNTAGLMEVNTTLCSSSTGGLSGGTGVHTMLLNASFIQGTIIVNAAFSQKIENFKKILIIKKTDPWKSELVRFKSLD